MLKLVPYLGIYLIQVNFYYMNFIILACVAVFIFQFLRNMFPFEKLFKQNDYAYVSTCSPLLSIAVVLKF